MFLHGRHPANLARTRRQHPRSHRWTEGSAQTPSKTQAGLTRFTSARCVFHLTSPAIPSSSPFCSHRMAAWFLGAHVDPYPNERRPVVASSKLTDPTEVFHDPNGSTIPGTPGTPGFPGPFVQVTGYLSEGTDLRSRVSTCPRRDLFGTHSIGLPRNGRGWWFEGSMGRHTWQSHGASGCLRIYYSYYIVLNASGDYIVGIVCINERGPKKILNNKRWTCIIPIW